MTKRLIAAVLFLTGILSAGSAIAQPGGVTWGFLFPGARATSLGSADVAGARGADAIYLNTAPLGSQKDLTVSYDWRDYFENNDLGNLAASGHLGRWRLSLASTAVSIYDYYDQSDYDPTLPSATVGFRERTIMGGVAYDLGSGLFRWMDKELVLGVGVRRIDSKLGDWKTGATGMDLGLTFGKHYDSDRNRRELAVAVNGQNLLDAKLEDDATGQSLEQRSQVGVTYSWASLGEKKEEAAAAPAKYELVGAVGYEFYSLADDAFKAGLEFIMAEVLSVRLGYNQGLEDEPVTWGLGLALDNLIGNSTRFAIDYGRVREIDLEGRGRKLSMWGIRGGFGFN